MRETPEAKKERIIAELREARMGVLEVARRLPPGKRDQVFLGEWSPAHLIAHLIGWDITNTQAVKEIMNSEVPSFYAHHDHDWRSYNAALVVKYIRNDFDALVSAAKASQKALGDFLASLPAQEFARDRGVRFKGYKVTIARLLAVEASDERTHAGQLKDYLEDRVHAE